MAHGSTSVKYGYDDARFEKEIDENFYCCICYNVLKEPRTCPNNEHVFCLACITQHLKVNSQKSCPVCKERLSLDALRRPRVLNNYLSKLKINCEYASRGCRQFIRVENLETHLANCGYAPVLCSNKKCRMEINRQEKVLHETEICEHRKGKHYDRGQVQEEVKTLKESVKDLDRKVEAANNGAQKNHGEMKRIVKAMDGRLTQLDRKMDAINRKPHEIEQVVKEEVENIRKEVKDVKDNLFKVNQEMGEVKNMMKQMFENLHRLELVNKMPSLVANPFDEEKKDILIAGGAESPKQYLRSTEIFSWAKNGWFNVSLMNQEHSGASSYILHGRMLYVVGGENTKTIDRLDLYASPLIWIRNLVGLPCAFDDHKTAIYRQRVIHIGGYFYETGLSNVISEQERTLGPNYMLKELCQMAEARERHCAEIFDDKILILGGTNDSAQAIDSVLEFDAKKNKCKNMPPLPHPLTQMATVRWRDEVVLLGGCDKSNNVRNEVFMYNSGTGETTALPHMLEKRYACCAVITGDTIVVMGGMDENKTTLRSVECFTMGESAWNYLPAMNRVRCKAVAEVLPLGRKYV